MAMRGYPTRSAPDPLEWARKLLYTMWRNGMTAQANVGVVGLAAMGASLARNLARHGNKVAVFNRSLSLIHI